MPETTAPTNERRDVLASLAGAVACLSALWAIQQSSAQQYIAAILGAALVPVTAAVGVTMVSCIVVLLKAVWKLLPIQSIPEEDSEPDVEVGDEENVGPEVLRDLEYYRQRKEYYKQKYLNYQAAAQSHLNNANHKIEHYRSEAADANERTAALRFTLTCGMFMAIGSAVATFIQPAKPETFLVRHVPALACAYALIALIFGFRAGASILPPNRNVAMRIGGLGALYVNAVSVTINLAYSWPSLFSDDAPRIAKVGDIPIGYLIVFARLVLLPTVSVIACWIGASIGRKR